MRIASSTLAMSGRHTQMESYTKSEELQFWTNNSDSSAAVLVRNTRDVLNLSSDAQALLAETNAPAAETAAGEGVEVELSEKDKHMINLIEKFIEVLTGKKIKLVVPEKLECGAEKQGNIPAFVAELNNNANADPGWGLRYEYHEVYQEAETLSFSAAGSITTKDGQKIDLNLTINMSRAYPVLSRQRQN